jgi:hypothetical protein
VLQPKNLLRYAAIGWTIAIFIGCALPSNQLGVDLSGRDKFIHTAIFLLFGLLWRLFGYRAWHVLLAGFLYGFFLEIYQGVMPINRSFELADGLADTVGTLIGVLLAEGAIRLKK